MTDITFKEFSDELLTRVDNNQIEVTQEERDIYEAFLSPDEKTPDKILTLNGYPLVVNHQAKYTEHNTPNGAVKITFEKPPVWNNICAAFGIVPDTAVFTYGDMIYNPNMMDLPDFIIEHEKVHMMQQGFSNEGAAVWWGKFLRDPEFRLDQEAQAYAAQYDHICLSRKVKDRNARFRIRMDLARILSGPLYHRAIGTIPALKLIEKYAKTK